MHRHGMLATDTHFPFTHSQNACIQVMLMLLLLLSEPHFPLQHSDQQHYHCSSLLLSFFLFFLKMYLCVFTSASSIPSKGCQLQLAGHSWGTVSLQVGSGLAGFPALTDMTACQQTHRMPCCQQMVAQPAKEKEPVTDAERKTSNTSLTKVSMVVRDRQALRLHRAETFTEKSI